MIKTVYDILAFEAKYRSDHKDDWMYEEADDQGELGLLIRGTFSKLAQSTALQKYMDKGLSPEEALVMSSFCADISGLYRLDAYNNGVPTEVEDLCLILESALSKLPSTNDSPVTRLCHSCDREDFQVGEIFIPGFHLSASAKSNNCYDCWVYEIALLAPVNTRARSVYYVKYSQLEKQVTFLMNSKFLISDISGKRIYMDELE